MKLTRLEFSAQLSVLVRLLYDRAGGVCLVLAIGCAMVVLAGCGPRRLRTDFTGYEKAYAETSNRELLLNLARLEKREPTYFFKIGTIQSTYKMAANVSGNGAYTVQSTNPMVGAPSGGGTPGITYENDPIFTFIPVNDETNAQYLIQPIPAATFYSLYEEGWRVDQLFRLMVDRIELTVPKGNSCEVYIYRNVPPPMYKNPDGTMDTTYSRDSEMLSQYSTFLRVSAILYTLQKHGDLVLSATNDFVPYDRKSKIEVPDSPTPPKSPTGDATDAHGEKTPATSDDVKNLLAAYLLQQLNAAKKSADSDSSSSSKVPTAGDISTASNKNAVWELQDAAPNGTNASNKPKQSWVLGEKKFTPIFYLNHYIDQTSPASNPQSSTGSNQQTGPDVNRIQNEILQDPDIAQLAEPPYLVPEVLHMLAGGFSISDSSNSWEDGVGPCPSYSGGTPQPASHLVMRSLIGLMAAAAQEQAPFEALMKYKPAIPHSSNPMPGELEIEKKFDKPTFTAAIPPIEQIPLLSLNPVRLNPESDKPEPEEDPIISVDYRGENYRIADLKSDEDTENAYWNRDVFRLINELTSQVTVDISKFPLTTILQ
jgi:hypothetical protein